MLSLNIYIYNAIVSLRNCVIKITNYNNTDHFVGNSQNSTNNFKLQTETQSHTEEECSVLSLPHWAVNVSRKNIYITFVSRFGYIFMSTSLHVINVCCSVRHLYVAPSYISRFHSKISNSESLSGNFTKSDLLFSEKHVYLQLKATHMFVLFSLLRWRTRICGVICLPQ